MSAIKRSSLNRRGGVPRLSTEQFAAGTTSAHTGQGIVWNGIRGFGAGPVARLPVAYDVQATAASGVVAGGAFEFNGSEITGGVRFRGVGKVSHAGLTGQVGLYDLTHGVFVAGATLSFTGTAAAMTQSALLSVGAGVGSIHEDPAIYEARLVLVGGAGTSSTTLGSAHLVFG